jgi:hypothetical protein
VDADGWFKTIDAGGKGTIHAYTNLYLCPCVRGQGKS